MFKTGNEILENVFLEIDWHVRDSRLLIWKYAYYLFKNALIHINPCCNWIEKYYHQLWRLTNYSFKQQILMNSALYTVCEWDNSNSDQQYYFIVNSIVTCIHPIIVFDVDISSFAKKVAQNVFKTPVFCCQVQGSPLMENKVTEWLIYRSVYWLILHMMDTKLPLILRIDYIICTIAKCMIVCLTKAQISTIYFQ